MATVTTPPARRFTLEESRRRVHHPLDRLRGVIRLYVALEGAGLTLLYLALWFWIGLLLDYGFFKLFTVDWVQVLPHRGWRITLLALVGSGLVAVVVLKVLLRLFREFRPAPLALVLERRFPKLLGDRLITAVEMADLRLAPRYGFSQAMIDHTIQDAAGRVDQVPLGQVFNWKRLVYYGVSLVGLTLGLYMLLGLGYLAVQRTWSVGRFVHSFGDVAVIWFERNILLINTIWPRRAHLELIGFPESGDLRIGRSAGSAPIKARALKWVIADKRTDEGWRALTWGELHDRIEDGVPMLPDSWLSTRPDVRFQEWTVDQVELYFARDEMRDLLDPDTRLAIERSLERLEELTQRPQNSRKYRKLEVPDVVYVSYWGSKLSNRMELPRGGDNEYSGSFKDLKESIEFTVRGADYSTAIRTITVVPPPALVKLERNEEQPAYLYQRPPLAGSLADLRGLKQQVRGVPVSLTGETSRLDVFSGTDLELVALADKDLAEVTLEPRERKGSEGPAPVARIFGLRKNDGAPEVLAAGQFEPQLDRDLRTIRTLFRVVAGSADFDFVFTDTDGVIGRRHVIIRALEDKPPDVDLLVDIVRRTPQGHFLVTPIAKVPFDPRNSKARDDHGLTDVEYAFTYASVEAQQGNVVRSLLVAGMVQFGPPSVSLLAPLYLNVLNREITSAQAVEEGDVERRRLESFARKLRQAAAGDVNADQLRQRLGQPAPANAWQPLMEHVLEADEGFDLKKLLPQLLAGGDAAQTRYRVRLWLVATDNYAEAQQPHSALSKEKFTLLVVSVEELLAEIGKEEEGLHVKAEDVYERLGGTQGALQKLERMKQDLTDPTFLKDDGNAGTIQVRAQEVEDILIKTSDITREIYADYSRILHELHVNRVGEVHKSMVDNVDRNICKRLDSILQREFPNSEEAARELRKSLEARKNDPQALDLARERMDQLLKRLDEVRNAMGDVTTINILISLVRGLEEKQRQQTAVFNRIKEKIEEDLINRALGGTEPKKN